MTLNPSLSDRHYTEAGLLETWYTAPGASMPVMMHLARCSDCAARYEGLERKLRGTAKCSTERPESFWRRQRASIMSGIASRRPAPRWTGAAMRFAAAAVLVATIGGVATFRNLTPDTPRPTTTQSVPSPAAQTITFDDAQLTADPWQSEQLREFHDVVEWESWVEPKSKTGETSL